jgi:hypothetical protein
MTTPTAACPPHHYVLPPPAGVECVGVCRSCGAVRAFSNEFVGRGDWLAHADEPLVTTLRKAERAGMGPTRS